MKAVVDQNMLNNKLNFMKNSYKRFVMIIVISLLAKLLNAQTCGTSAVDMHAKEYKINFSTLKSVELTATKLKSARSSATSSIITVSVVFHIYNNSISSATADQLINNLNDAFGAFNIRFKKLCENFIPKFGNTDKSVDLPYAINVYIYDYYFPAYAGAIGSNTIYIPNGSSLISLVHEMGHCLYLFHTHNERGCLEKIDGSNCETCGDHICDTPADPGLITTKVWVDSNCNYTGKFTLDGKTYNPDTRNHMSYSPAECRNRFTIGQGIRMYNALTSLSVLIPTTRPPEIEGAKVICSGEVTYRFKSLPNSTVTWSSSNPNGLAINASTGIAKSVSGFIGAVTITAAVNGGCGSVALPSRIVWVGLPLSAPGVITADVSNVCVGRQIQFMIQQIPGVPQIPAGADGITWVSNNPSNLAVEGNGIGAIITGRAVTSGYFATFTASAFNACGSRTTTWATNVKPRCGGGGGLLRVSAATYPNPVTSSLTVQLTDSLATNKTTELLERPYELHIIDRYQRTVLSLKSSEKTLNIPTDGLPSDVYYLHVYFKDGVIRKQLVIQK